MKIIWSEAATAEPNGKPHTDDMREMIEYFRSHEMIRRIPASYMVGGDIIMHPAMRSEYEKAVKRVNEQIDNHLPGWMRR